MSLEIESKLKSVIRLAHQKGVVTASFLRQQGVSYQSMLKYRRANWLASLGAGAFCESGTKPSLDMALVALVEQLGLPVHVGGISALNRRGIMHYVRLGGLPDEVYLRRGFRLPKWFGDAYAGQFRRNSSSLFADGVGVEQDAGGCAVSSPERAFLEMAAEVPNEASLGELYQTMEFADSLRPKLVEKLLAGCRSVKAKRIFLLIADDLGHWWAKKIDHGKVDLGKGCRMIDKDGELHPKYNLVVRPWRDR